MSFYPALSQEGKARNVTNRIIARFLYPLRTPSARFSLHGFTFSHKYFFTIALH